MEIGSIRLRAYKKEFKWRDGKVKPSLVEFRLDSWMDVSKVISL